MSSVASVYFAVCVVMCGECCVCCVLCAACEALCGSCVFLCTSAVGLTSSPPLAHPMSFDLSTLISLSLSQAIINGFVEQLATSLGASSGASGSSGGGLGDNIGDAEYLYAFKHAVMPAAKRFQPELVIVSCGFDAADGDPLGGCSLTPAGYAAMTRQLQSLADGKIVLVLEGGYNLDSISSSAAACVQALLGDEVVSPKVGEPSPRAVAVVDRVADLHRRTRDFVGQ